ncbi:GumC family protein [Candidatus Margulisiibacteriota bacterium]
MELVEYYKIFLRRRKIIFTVFFTIVGISLIGLFTVKPVYQSSAKLLVFDSPRSSVLSSLLKIKDYTGGFGLPGRTDLSAINVELIKTRPVFKEVIKKLDLRDKKGKLVWPDILGRNVIVTSIRNTNIIVVSYKNKDNQLASDIANTIANVFVDYNKTVNQEESRQARVFIESLLEKQKQCLNSTEEKLLECQSSDQTVDLSSETKQLISRLADLHRIRADSETQLKMSIAKIKDLEAKLKDSYGSYSPFVTYWKKEINRLNIHLPGLEANNKTLDNEIRKIDNQLNKLPPKKVRIARLVSDSKIENTIYDNLLMHLEETKIAEAAQVGTVRIIESAEPSRHPIFPKKRKGLMGAVLLGLITGSLVCLVLEYFDKRLHKATEVSDITGWTKLGIIPHDSEAKDALAVRYFRNSPVVSSFSTLRTELHYGLDRSNKKSLLITSCNSLEGKTTVAVNLAISEAMVGRKVALIDLNIRDPKLHSLLNLPNTPGFTNVVTGEVIYQQAINRLEDVPNLAVFTSGPLPAYPEALLEHSNLGKLMRTLEDDFDIVIVDASAINIVSDAMILGHKTDGVLFVVDMELCSSEDLKQVAENCRNLNINPVGYVVNNFRPEKEKYLYRYPFSNI